MAGISFNSVVIRSKAETIVNGSRFIAVIKNIKTETEAENFINEIRKEYGDAKHIPYAYVVFNEKTKRLKEGKSDDAEPMGSAGVSILNTLKTMNFANVCVVVVRYFGGTLLGVGALTRAYVNTVEKVVKNSAVLNFNLMDVYECAVSYGEFKKLEQFATSLSFKILDSVYEEDVFVTIAVLDSEFKRINTQLNDEFARKIVFKFKESKVV